MADIKFTGNVGKDPELRYTKGGDPFLTFSVADSKSRKDDSGQWETLAEQWLRVTIWRDLAEFYADKILRGTRVTVYGDFMSREFEGKDGKALSLDVTAKGVEVHPKRGQQQSNGSAPQAQPQGIQTPAASDPWGTPAPDNNGWGNGPDNSPAF